jgi:hypothetical protein
MRQTTKGVTKRGRGQQKGEKNTEIRAKESKHRQKEGGGIRGHDGEREQKKFNGEQQPSNDGGEKSAKGEDDRTKTKGGRT